MPLTVARGTPRPPGPFPGTYALILSSSTRRELQIGRWGCLGVEPGFYLYVGSALGPGGVRARVSRHLRERERRHWHIDYLRPFVDPMCVWYRHAAEICEHGWAGALARTDGITPVRGFGCSDCRCEAHLFISRAVPEFARFSDAVGGGVESWYPDKSKKQEQKQGHPLLPTTAVKKARTPTTPDNCRAKSEDTHHSRADHRPGIPAKMAVGVRSDRWLP